MIFITLFDTDETGTKSYVATTPHFHQIESLKNDKKLSSLVFEISAPTEAEITRSTHLHSRRCWVIGEHSLNKELKHQENLHLPPTHGSSGDHSESPQQEKIGEPLLFFKAGERSRTVDDENKTEEAPRPWVNGGQEPTQSAQACWAVEMALCGYKRIHCVCLKCVSQNTYAKHMDM